MDLELRIKLLAGVVTCIIVISTVLTSTLLAIALFKHGFIAAGCVALFTALFTPALTLPLYESLEPSISATLCRKHKRQQP